MNLLSRFAKELISYREKELEQKVENKGLQNVRIKKNTSGHYPSLEREELTILKKIFPEFTWKRRVKLPEMRNPMTNRLLELDIFSPELRIAVEHQGEYHTRYSQHYHKSPEEFRKQQERDMIKKELCKRNGIHLICVPYDIHRESLQDFLLLSLAE